MNIGLVETMRDGILPAKRSSPDIDHIEEGSSKQTKKSSTSSSEAITGKSNKDESTYDDLMYVYEELEIGKRTQQQLVDIGVTMVNDILGRKDDFKEVKVGSVRKVIQQQLYNFCLWHEDFYKTNDEGEPWRKHFTIGSLDAFTEKLTNLESDAKANFEQAKMLIHAGDQGEFGDLLSDEERDALNSYVAELVIKKLPREVVDACNFDVKDYSKSFAGAITNLPTGSAYPKIQLIAGQTQSGKSNVKVVVRQVCELFDCPLIIITKGVAESEDLFMKLHHKKNQDKSALVRFLDGTSKNNRCIVVADTSKRINTAIKMVNAFRKVTTPHGKFVVIVDESDAMYRTEEREQQFEQAFDRLMDMGPALRIEISATPIPTYFSLSAQEYEFEMYELGTSEDYCGVNEIKPLQDEHGNDMYLKDLKCNEGVPYKGINQRLLKNDDTAFLFPEDDGDDRKVIEEKSERFDTDELEFIPGTNDAVMKLYEDALSEAENGEPIKKGVLALDCTVKNVKVNNNLFQKSACVQNHFARKEKDMVIVVVVGDGIYFRRPGYRNGRKIHKDRKTMSEVIEQLDREFGLGVPIFIFGYSKIRRCVSFRSKFRVPTHIILSLGLGQSNESFIQALGRATFNGLEAVLQQNGFSHVTALTNESDLAMSRKHPNFVHEWGERVKAGTGVNDTRDFFTDSANYLRHTNRKTGQNKDLKNRLPDQGRFEAPVDVASYDKDDTAKRIMKAVLDLVHDTLNVESFLDKDLSEVKDGEGDGDDKKVEEALEKINKRGFTVTEILDKYNDTYQDDEHTINNGALSKELTQLKKEAKLEKGTDKRWRAKNLRALMQECSYTPTK